MTIELGTVLTIVTVIGGLFAFYFAQLRGLDTRLATLKDEVGEKIDKVKDHLNDEIGQVKIIQANHGTRLNSVEGFVGEVNRRFNTHVNGKHSQERG